MLYILLLINFLLMYQALCSVISMAPLHTSKSTYAFTWPVVLFTVLFSNADKRKSMRNQFLAGCRFYLSFRFSFSTLFSACTSMTSPFLVNETGCLSLWGWGDMPFIVPQIVWTGCLVFGILFLFFVFW